MRLMMEDVQEMRDNSEKVWRNSTIAVRGMTALKDAGSFAIRVFAQVSAMKAGELSQSIASQGSDVGCCYVSVEDACTAGCNSACHRATAQNIISSPTAYQECSEACIKACVRPDVEVGKFSTCVIKD